MHRRPWMRRLDFDTEAVMRLAWRGVQPINLDAPAPDDRVRAAPAVPALCEARRGHRHRTILSTFSARSSPWAWAYPCTPRKIVPLRSASVISAPAMLAPVRSAPPSLTRKKLVPRRLAPRGLQNTINDRLKSAPASVAPARLALDRSVGICPIPWFLMLTPTMAPLK